MDIVQEYWPYAAALIPTAGVAFLFYWIIRYMIEADRAERKALARWNAAQRDDEGGSSGTTDDGRSGDSSSHSAGS